MQPPCRGRAAALDGAGGRALDYVAPIVNAEERPLAEAGQLTRLLADYRNGDRSAFDRLVPLVYPDLQRIARAHLRRLPSGQTLDTNGLVHEAWMKLVDGARVVSRPSAAVLRLEACRGARTVGVRVSRGRTPRSSRACGG